MNHKNTQDLAIEMSEVKCNRTPKIVKNRFYNDTGNHYNVRHWQETSNTIH